METKYIEALDKVMAKRYPAQEYSLDGYQEDSVCLQKEGDEWIVYIGERGRRFEEVKCKTILLACLEFIHKATSKIDVITEMEKEFLDFISSE